MAETTRPKAALLLASKTALATLEAMWEDHMSDRMPDMERWNDTMKELRTAISMATREGR